MSFPFPFVPPVSAADGNDSFTKLLLHCDGADASTTFTDVSVGGAHGAMTTNGHAQVDTAQSVFGGASLLCDGTTDYLSFASHADWNLGAAGSGDFTIDFRLRFATVALAGLVATQNIAVSTGWALYWNANNLVMYDGAAKSVAWTPSSNTWYHVAVVRSGGTMTAYINGTSIGTYTDFDMNNDSGQLGIGAGNDGSFSLNGWMDEVRISKGIARWTTNFTPPTAAYA